MCAIYTIIVHNVTWKDVQIHMHFKKNKSSQEGESSLPVQNIINNIYLLFDHITAIQDFDSGPVTARNITRKSVLPNFARHVLSKS